MAQHIPGSFEPTDSAAARTRRTSGPTEVTRPQHHLHTDSQPLPAPTKAEQEYLASEDHIPGTQDQLSSVSQGMRRTQFPMSGASQTGPGFGATEFMTPTDQFMSTSDSQASPPKFGSQFSPDEPAKSPFADLYKEESGKLASDSSLRSEQGHSPAKEGRDTDALFGGAQERFGEKEPTHFQHSLAGQPGRIGAIDGGGYQTTTTTTTAPKSDQDSFDRHSETMREGPPLPAKALDKEDFETSPQAGGQGRFGNEPDRPARPDVTFKSTTSGDAPRTAAHTKVSMGDKLLGKTEKAFGKLTKDTELEEKGQLRAEQGGTAAKAFTKN